MAEEREISQKSLTLGIVLILLTNTWFLATNYIVSWSEISATEVCLFRGVLQLFINTIIELMRRRKKKKNVKSDKEDSFDLKILMLSLLCGFCSSSINLLCIEALLMIPVGDLIVIVFSSPIFTVFLSRLILKRAITLLALSVCILIFVGDILVIRPPFIFPSSGSTNASADEAVSRQISSDVRNHHDSFYFLGIGLTAISAFLAGLNSVVSSLVLNKGVTPNQLVLANGAFSFVFSLAAIPFIDNRLVTNPVSLSAVTLLCIAGVSVLHTMCFFQLNYAFALTDRPTLVTVVRSTEVLFSLVTESIWWGQLPSFLSIAGALMISVCVVVMTYQDRIKSWIQKKFGGRTYVLTYI